jgi:hypothetical protein
MSDHRRRILDMLSEGKINAGEADRLIGALGTTTTVAAPAPGGRPKYLRVVVDANDPKDGQTKVNVRVPLQLLRAGMRLSNLIPAAARNEVNAAMAHEGLPFDINQLKPENIDALIEQFNDLTVDVDNENAKVRVFCE